MVPEALFASRALKKEIPLGAPSRGVEGAPGDLRPHFRPRRP